MRLKLTLPIILLLMLPRILMVSLSLPRLRLAREMWKDLCTLGVSREIRPLFPITDRIGWSR